NQTADLTAIPLLGQTPPNVYLGGAGGGTNPDQRDHPYFRTEWLQKVANLTTVRTHQYAVWITVGFFEVTRQGDPLLANVNPVPARPPARPGPGRPRRQKPPLPRVLHPRPHPRHRVQPGPAGRLPRQHRLPPVDRVSRRPARRPGVAGDAGFHDDP